MKCSELRSEQEAWLKSFPSEYTNQTKIIYIVEQVAIIGGNKKRKPKFGSEKCGPEFGPDKRCKEEGTLKEVKRGTTTLSLDGYK